LKLAGRYNSLFIVLVMLSGAGNLANGQAVEAVAEVFQAENVIGTLVVATANGAPVYVLNEERSRVQFSPASTFKVPNTLIALDAGVVTSRDSSFTWDGTDKSLRLESPVSGVTRK